jgi:hypothetical protein
VSEAVERRQLSHRIDQNHIRICVRVRAPSRGWSLAPAPHPKPCVSDLDLHGIGAVRVPRNQEEAKIVEGWDSGRGGGLFLTISKGRQGT